MKTTHPWRGALLLLAFFLALTSVVSAPLILADRVGLPPELLAGSPFSSYLIPGLALLLGVGLPATAATMGLAQKHPLALPASFVAGRLSRSLKSSSLRSWAGRGSRGCTWWWGCCSWLLPPGAGSQRGVSRRPWPRYDSQTKKGGTMDGFGVTLQWGCRRAPSLVLGNNTLTPEAWVLSGRLPGVGFVWNRPSAVLVERDGQRQHLPIVDVTRWVELGLWGLAALLMLATIRMNQPR